jgi:hypothetical protein
VAHAQAGAVANDDDGSLDFEPVEPCTVLGVGARWIGACGCSRMNDATEHVCDPMSVLDNGTALVCNYSRLPRTVPSMVPLGC